MSENQIRFDDGAGYERMMGVWSRLAGDVFLDWLAPRPGQRWVDVGCGNGAFTELLVARCSPAEVHGVDPSEAQLSFARSRHTAGIAHFQQGDAMALPFGDSSFDAAVMALVIFFVPEPAQGVAEMKRVVKRPAAASPPMPGTFWSPADYDGRHAGGVSGDRPYRCCRHERRYRAYPRCARCGPTPA